MALGNTTSLVDVLVLGTTQGTAYDGASGQNNANNITTLQSAIADIDTIRTNAALATTAIQSSTKGVADGVASLDSTGKVPTTQLPAYVDEIVEGYYDSTTDTFYKDSAKTEPITPSTGKIYVDIPTNQTYRWSGSAYIALSAGAAWGSITGTLTDQLDLNTALEGKQPTITSSTDLTVNSLTANLLTGGLSYTTTAPTSANTNGIKFAILSSMPTTRYNGWIYIITE